MLTTASPLKTPVFEINALGSMAARLRDEFMIVWIREGSLCHHIDMCEYVLGPMLYGIRPGHAHQLLAQDNVQGYVLIFDAACTQGWDGMDPLLSTGVFQRGPVDLLAQASEAIRTDIADVFSQLAVEYNRNALYRLDLLRGYLGVLLAYLFDQAGSHAGTEDSEVSGSSLVKRFFSLLSRNFRAKKFVADYAADLRISPSYLNEIIKKATGKPVSFHIREQVIGEAKKQAFRGELSMKETAYGLGFDDISHFSKYFKQATGMNFSTFRKRELAWG
jgi:AraC-like DNA-binding protein